MKNQYFGDVKDLFKYDLVEWLLGRIPSATRFTFITMLTENDGRNDGQKLDYRGRSGCGNVELVRFLSDRVRRGRRNVSEIREYFESRGIGIVIHWETGFFEHASRDDYFSGIDDETLAHSVIVVDPDNGLEVKNSRERHLLYSEAAGLYERMSDDSILLLFQHFRREKHGVTLEKVSAGLENACGRKPSWICDREAAFFALARDTGVGADLSSALEEYRRRYPFLRTG